MMSTCCGKMLGTEMHGNVSSIPHVIHEIWLDTQTESNTVALPKYDKTRSTWKEMNPTFAFEFWNIQRVKDLLNTVPELGEFKSFWLKLSKHIEKCDFARYVILYALGGFYKDLDFYCTRAIEPILSNRQLLMMWEPKEHQGFPYNKRLFNGILASIPKHTFWLELMKYIVNHYNPRSIHVQFTTGPIQIGKFIIKNRIHIDHPEYFGNTCWFLFATAKARYCAQCLVSKQDFKSDIFYKWFDDRNQYGYTLWNESTEWGKENLNNSTGDSKTIIKTRASSTLSSTDLIILWVFIGLIATIIVFTIVGVTCNTYVKSRRKV
jgi:hypothetical protein